MLLRESLSQCQLALLRGSLSQCQLALPTESLSKCQLASASLKGESSPCRLTLPMLRESLRRHSWESVLADYLRYR